MKKFLALFLICSCQSKGQNEIPKIVRSIDSVINFNKSKALFSYKDTTKFGDVDHHEKNGALYDTYIYDSSLHLHRLVSKEYHDSIIFINESPKIDSFILYTYYFDKEKLKKILCETYKSNAIVDSSFYYFDNDKVIYQGGNTYLVEITPALIYALNIKAENLRFLIRKNNKVK